MLYQIEMSGYTPEQARALYVANFNPPEEFRAVEVKVDDPEYQVKTIRGYYPGK